MFSIFFSNHLFIYSINTSKYSYPSDDAFKRQKGINEKKDVIIRHGFCRVVCLSVVKNQFEPTRTIAWNCPCTMHATYTYIRFNQSISMTKAALCIYVFMFLICFLCAVKCITIWNRVKRIYRQKVLLGSEIIRFALKAGNKFEKNQLVGISYTDGNWTKRVRKRFENPRDVYSREKYRLHW